MLHLVKLQFNANSIVVSDEAIFFRRQSQHWKWILWI